MNFTVSANLVACYSSGHEHASWVPSQMLNEGLGARISGVVERYTAATPAHVQTSVFMRLGHAAMSVLLTRWGFVLQMKQRQSCSHTTSLQA